MHRRFKNSYFFLALLTWGLLCFVIIAAAASWLNHGFVWTLLRTDIPSSDKLEEIQRFFLSYGSWAWLVYTTFVIVEVMIAPIPGIMLYAPGGVIFGGFKGGLLSLVGNTVGAGIACFAVRTVSDAWMRRFFSTEKLKTTQDLLEQKGFWLVFLLRINPLTSSDLVSYAAGLTRIPVWKVMMATSFGMAPLCFAQAYLAENLMHRYPWLLYPLGACLLIYFAVVIVVVLKTRKNAMVTPQA